LNKISHRIHKIRQLISCYQNQLIVVLFLLIVLIVFILVVILIIFILIIVLVVVLVIILIHENSPPFKIIFNFLGVIILPWR